MILVTGGAGFIGSNLVAAFEKAGEAVAVCDWLGHDNKWRNLSKRMLEDIVAPENLDIFLKERGAEITLIVHMGAISTTTETNVDHIVENNLRLSQKLWLWCRDHGKRFIYASSAATYGDGAQGFVDGEDDAHLSRLHPLNPYGWSKHAFDRWVAARRKYSKAAPAQCVGLKFFNVYGPNEYHKGPQRSVVEQVYPFAMRGEAFQLFKSHRPDYADGGQLRDFIWVGDCVKVIMWMAAHPETNGLFNLGTGQSRSFADLARAVYAAAGKEPQIAYRNMPEALRDKYQYFTQADMRKLRAAGYTDAFTSLEDGVRAYVRDYLMADDPYV
ncbi:MAG: ADP-glyceromanno-heptose 6-epimerase [Alphaproteobacteria bacterium]|nr:ADP-glyceromanno-heptose 6-epimerase [Alphaproteobacteria bacterium]